MEIIEFIGSSHGYQTYGLRLGMHNQWNHTKYLV